MRGAVTVAPGLPPAVPSPRATTDVLPWATLLALSAGHLAVDCCTGIWPVFKSLARLDLAMAGLIATVGSMAANGLQLVFGQLADRGWRRPLLLGGVAAAAAITLVPYAGSYGWMFGLQLATALGSAAFHPSGAGAAAEVSRSRTGVMLGIFLAGGYLGYACSQLLFTAVYLRAPRLTPVIGIVPLLAVAALALLLPAGPARAAAAAAGTRLGPHLARLAPLFLVQVFSTTVNLSLIFLLPELMAARAAPDWIARGGAHFGLVAGSCLALLPAGHAADRWGARRVLAIGNSATGLLLALFLATPGQPSLDLLLVVGFGLFNGVNTVVTVAEGNRLLPGRASGVSSWLMGLPWCVAALGPVVAGTLAEPARGGSPAAAMGWVGLALPLALGASLAVRRRGA